MAHGLRKFTKRIFILANIVVAAVFLLACCNSFLNPEKWWFIAILGLAFPFLLMLIAGFVIFWLLFRSKWVFLSLATLILGFTNIRALLGFRFNKQFTLQKSDTAIRILSWNVTSFDEQTKPKKRTRTYRKEMLEFIRKQNPDILCFQEYLEPNLPERYYSNVEDITRLGYPFHFIVSDYKRKNGTFHMGVAVFSRFPIIDSMRIQYPGPRRFRAAESLIAADISVYGKTIRVFNTHLQSILLQKKDYRNLEIIKNAEDSMVEASKSVVKKLKQGYTFRADQVDIVRRELDSSPFPEIICGDFNDIPNSYTYFQIKGDRQDAFAEAGSGIGRTFFTISPTLRIDYIIADKEFDVLQYKRYILPYSDHYPVITDLKLRGAAQQALAK